MRGPVWDLRTLLFALTLAGCEEPESVCEGDIVVTEVDAGHLDPNPVFGEPPSRDFVATCEEDGLDVTQ